jgi:D-alanyl-D-alanine carboxypeptidase/D-alanyl-D-alanine-endopeptidase (penicillin-binding protein 4)
MRLKTVPIFALAALLLVQAPAHTRPRQTAAPRAPAEALGARTHGGNILPLSLADAIIASGLSPGSFGLYAQDVDSGRAVLSLNEEAPYSMASTAKIVTSLAALDLLGPFYRWRTSAFALGTLADGKLVGDLLIVGGGNAQLTSTELSAWFARMRSQGLREIDGDIVLDRYAFQLTPADHTGTPVPTAAAPRHVWPDAMTLDEGLVTLAISPGAGRRPALSLHPEMADVRIDNRLQPGAGCEAAPRWEAAGDGAAVVVVTGRWGPACGARSIEFVPPPDSGVAARALPGMWAAAGGVLRGRVVSAQAVPGVSPIPLGADGEPAPPWSFHRSRPLPEVVRDMNKNSDNVAARNLMLSLSPGFPARPATIAGARRTVNLWLREQGLVEGDIELENGSGLSHSERARPRALAQLLSQAWRGDQAQAFVDSLPVAGVDGTLRNRLVGGSAAGHAFLKTGTLNDTRALAGYVRAASGRLYAVALMVNGTDAARGRPVMDTMIEWIARHG